MSKQVCVLGSGAIGISCASHLLQRGWDVTLIDAKPPASKTSFGSAGVINSGAFIPNNNPDLLSELPAYLSNLHPSVRYNIGYGLRKLPWLIRFFSQAGESKASQNAHDLFQLVSLANDEHMAMMKQSNNRHRYSETGCLKVYREDRPKADLSFERRLLSQFGVDTDVLTIQELRDLEPSLSPIFNSALWVKDAGMVNNPAALLREYAASYIHAGGHFKQQKVLAIEPLEDSYRLELDDEFMEFDTVVVAAGPWSGKLLSPLGYNLPLASERGYHLHFNLTQESTLSRPVHDVDGAYIMSPLEQGLRVTTGVEFNQADAASNASQLLDASARVNEAIQIESQSDDDVWCGARPSFPDAKPIIGESPHHKGLWFAFGHGHIGFNCGPITGKLLAQAMTGEPTDIDLRAFRADRFK